MSEKTCRNDHSKIALMSDEEITAAFQGTDFGLFHNHIEMRRKLIAGCLLKLFNNYYSGHTISRIVQELGLAKNMIYTDKRRTFTKKGREYLYYYFQKDVNDA